MFSINVARVEYHTLLQTCSAMRKLFLDPTESHSELYNESSSTISNAPNQRSSRPPGDPLDKNYTEHLLPKVIQLNQHASKLVSPAQTNSSAVVYRHVHRHEKTFPEGSNNHRTFRQVRAGKFGERIIVYITYMCASRVMACGAGLPMRE